MGIWAIRQLWEEVTKRQTSATEKRETLPGFMQHVCRLQAEHVQNLEQLGYRLSAKGVGGHIIIALRWFQHRILDAA